MQSSVLHPSAMTSQSPKILFTDIDETLVTTDKRLTDENRQAVDAFLDRGNILAITTGRALKGACNLVKEFGLYGRENVYICAFNGGQIFDTFRRQTLFKTGLGPDQVRRIDLLAHAYGIHMHAYNDQEVLSETDNEHLRKYCAIQLLPFRLVPDLADALDQTTCKLLAIDYADPAHLAGFRSFLEERVTDICDLSCSNRWLLEIMPKGVNKGQVLIRLAKALSVPLDHTISAGDEENDIPMIKAAGIGCAMANGQESLKKIADYVTAADNNHSGIAEILRKFS